MRLLYGMEWADGYSDLKIEMEFVRAGGHISGKSGKRYGEGLYHHMRRMFTLIWPTDDHHRWSDLALQRKVENDLLVLCGSSDSGKTMFIARWVLCDWWAHSNNTLWMVSSTELRGAELRIWGKIKELFNRGRELHRWLPGTVLESKTAITTEQIDDEGESGRLLTKGIIFIPCISGGSWVGLGRMIGVKSTKDGRLGHAGDEVSVMSASFLDAYSNWYGKENFQGLLTGNPTDLEDPLCKAAEPIDGWENWADTGKTQEWKSKFYGAHVIAFDGRDSPNFDFPESEPTHYKYLIGRKKLKAVAAKEGEDSPLYWMQCVGKPRPGAEKLKVITRQLCEQGGAYEDVVWEGSETTDVVSLDAAYGGVGGDRCVLMRIRFGKDVEGASVIECYPPVIVPVSAKKTLEIPEDQIARFCMNWCNGFAIGPKSFFFDGRSTLAVSFARIWSPEVNVVDFGGPATKRPVSLDEFVWDGDTDTRRLKRCDEHYSKFVTELWFSTRYLILGKQLRNLPREVAEEGWKRQWRYTKGSPPRIEVETKAEMKERTGRSPDFYDSLVIAVEGARRLGFQIETLKEDAAKVIQDEDWIERELEKHKRSFAASELKALS